VREIKFNGEKFKIKISSIEENAFKDFPNLERLEMTSLEIFKINSDSFCHLQHLKELDLRENKLTIGGFANMYYWSSTEIGGGTFAWGQDFGIYLPKEFSVFNKLYVSSKLFYLFTTIYCI
jgi:hypothetical protein